MRYSNHFGILLTLLMLGSRLFPGTVEIRGITIEEKINGALIRVKTTGAIDPSQISAWMSETGWFYVTMVGTRIDTSRQWPFARTGIVGDFESHQFPELAQLNFKLSRRIESFEVDSTEREGEILIALRLPLSESLAAVSRMKSLKRKEMTLGENRTRIERIGRRLPYVLLVTGCGLVARGLLRSDETELILGSVMAAGGYFLARRKQAN